MEVDGGRWRSKQQTKHKTKLITKRASQDPKHHTYPYHIGFVFCEDGQTFEEADDEEVELVDKLTVGVFAVQNLGQVLDD